LKENGNLRLIKNAIYGKSVEAHTLIELSILFHKEEKGPT
jgi:hypothetical protein